MFPKLLSDSYQTRTHTSSLLRRLPHPPYVSHTLLAAEAVVVFGLLELYAATKPPYTGLPCTFAF
jgi:hypothetical protein